MEDSGEGSRRLRQQDRNYSYYSRRRRFEVSRRLRSANPGDRRILPSDLSLRISTIKQRLRPADLVVAVDRDLSFRNTVIVVEIQIGDHNGLIFVAIADIGTVSMPPSRHPPA
ncbi:hypothetical protein TIFTF001_038739 [Ficus carica]|uniref:Uncharacterized protein n=1 Tax=Ficus carica TaxID=3494 RepID=A0AA88E8L1_FICCA|nr:hypothetical protein TIFTF001_038739 [Ficus carica]